MPCCYSVSPGYKKKIKMKMNINGTLKAMNGLAHLIHSHLLNVTLR